MQPRTAPPPPGTLPGPFPLCPPTVAAGVLKLRDAGWATARPRAAALSLAEVGVPAVYLTPLPTDSVTVRLPDPPGATLRYEYTPFAIPGELLGCLDDPLSPGAGMRLLLAAVDACVSEATARGIAGGLPPGSSLATDHLMPLLVYVAARAGRWTRPHATLSYLGTFGTGGSTAGKEAFAVTLMTGAVDWIEKRCAAGAEEAVAAIPFSPASVVDRYFAGEGDGAGVLGLVAAARAASLDGGGTVLDFDDDESD